MEKNSRLVKIQNKFLSPVLEKLEVIKELQYQEKNIINTFINENQNYKLLYEQSNMDKISALIEQRWKIIDSFDSIRFNNYEFQCQICSGNINTNTARQYRSECIFKGGILIRFECPHCGCIIGPLKMLTLDKDNFDLDYSQHYSIFSEGDTTEDEKFTFYQLEPQKDKCYLNYGCGSWSRTIDELRAEGFNIYGYDPYACNSNRSYIITSMDVLAGMRFDGIFSNNVLEHLTNPIETFLLFKHLLIDNNGKMIHSTPCYDYLYEYTRFHLFFYTGKSLQILCDHVGMESYGRYDEIRNNNKYTSFLFREKQLP